MKVKNKIEQRGWREGSEVKKSSGCHVQLSVSHTVVHNHLELQFQGIHGHGARHTWSPNTHTHETKY